MNMRRLFISLMLALTVAASAVTTPIPDMKFRRLDTRDGLSSSQVNCVFQDSKGYVWIGTPYGLNRYDGYRFKTFYSNIRDTTSMRDNYTDQIFEAFDGKLWLKQNMNYCVYDPVTERFERNPMRILSKFGINGGLEILFIDSKKNFWVKLYEQGMFYYNPKTKRLHQFTLGYDKNQLNPTYGISTMAEVGDQVIFTTNCGEMICMNGETGTVAWENKWMRQNGAHENQSYRLSVDAEQNYWITTLEYSFVFIKKENRWYKSVREYLVAHGFENVPEDLMAWNILIDRHGWVWMSVDHEGLIVFDPKTRQLRQFKNSKYDETTISDNTPRQIYQAPDGKIWICTYKNGVNQYVESLSSFKSIELGDVNTVTEDKYGNYWVGTNDQGILVYDPKADEVVSHYTRDNSGLSGNIMVGSWAAKDGSIWFGSYNGGLSRCIPSASDPTKATIVNYRSTGDTLGLANNSVWALTEDRWQRIWMTTLGGGIQMLDPKTQKFRTWNTTNTQLPSDYMTTIGWTKKGWVLAGCSYYYVLVNPATGQLMPQALPEDPAITVNISSTMAVIEDSRGLIWQGSTSGATVYDPKTKEMTLLDMTKGLYGSGINSIIEDKQHRVWVVTDHGVSAIVPQKQDDGSWQFLVRSFNSRDGLQQTVYNQRSTWLTRDGLILVGGQGGLDIINPMQIANKGSKEKPIFSGLQLFDRDVAVGEEIKGRVILHEALDVCREVDLRFTDQFTIQLASDAGSVKNHKRFAYKLMGFNEDWVKTSELNPNITYNSLRAGSYVLCVRMLNDDGTIGEEESQLEITIHPPLWRTRWMILLYMLLIALAAWLWRRRFLRRHNEMAELRALRSEMEKKQWMNEMRNQMREESQTATPVEEESQRNPWEIGALNKSAGDLAQFMKEQCAQFKAPDGKKVKFSFFPLANDLMVDFDHDLMGQAIQILLNNSVMFSPRDCRIKVFVDKTSDHASIRISDNGIGLPAGAKEHMFDPYVSDDDSGMCLYIVKDIVTAHGGTVTGDDNAGGGSVFTVTLPLEHDEVEEAVLMDEE